MKVYYESVVIAEGIQRKDALMIIGIECEYIIGADVMLENLRASGMYKRPVFRRGIDKNM